MNVTDAERLVSKRMDREGITGEDRSIILQALGIHPTTGIDRPGGSRKPRVVVREPEDFDRIVHLKDPSQGSLPDWQSLHGPWVKTW